MKNSSRYFNVAYAAIYRYKSPCVFKRILIDHESYPILVFFTVSSTVKKMSYCLSSCFHGHIIVFLAVLGCLIYKSIFYKCIHIWSPFEGFLTSSFFGDRDVRLTLNPQLRGPYLINSLKSVWRILQYTSWYGSAIFPTPEVLNPLYELNVLTEIAHLEVSTNKISRSSGL